MTKVLGFLHRLEWGNPYVSPPDGVKVAMEVFIPANDEGCRMWPKEMEEKYWELRKLYQSGIYGHTIRAITEFPKELSRETLKSIRQKRLKRRIEEKYPLFAEVFVQEELIRKKDYYDGITDPTIEEKRNEIKKQHNEERSRLGLE